MVFLEVENEISRSSAVRKLQLFIFILTQEAVNSSFFGALGFSSFENKIFPYLTCCSFLQNQVCLKLNDFLIFGSFFCRYYTFWIIWVRVTHCGPRIENLLHADAVDELLGDAIGDLEVYVDVREHLVDHVDHVQEARPLHQHKLDSYYPALSKQMAKPEQGRTCTKSQIYLNLELEERDVSHSNAGMY